MNRKSLVWFIRDSKGERRGKASSHKGLFAWPPSIEETCASELNGRPATEISDLLVIRPMDNGHFLKCLLCHSKGGLGKYRLLKARLVPRLFVQYTNRFHDKGLTLQFQDPNQVLLFRSQKCSSELKMTQFRPK